MTVGESANINGSAEPPRRMSLADTGLETARSIVIGLLRTSRGSRDFAAITWCRTL